MALEDRQAKAKSPSIKNTRSTLPTANVEAISDSVGRATKAKIRRRRNKRKQTQKQELEKEDEEDEEDEKDQAENPVDNVTIQWRDEFDGPDKWIPLRRTSEKFDIKDPFWSNRLISVALKTIDRVLERDKSEDDESPAPQEDSEHDIPSVEKLFAGIHTLNEEILSENRRAQKDLEESINA